MAVSKIQGKEQEIIHEYLKNERTVKSLAEEFGITTRTIQRLAEKLGVSDQVSKVDRQATAWKTSPALKIHRELCKANSKYVLGIKRKNIPTALKAIVYKQGNNKCEFCGKGKEANLHIDHIDENTTNNDIDNLRLLCMQCNLGRNTFYKKISKYKEFNTVEQDLLNQIKKLKEHIEEQKKIIEWYEDGK